MKPTRENTVDSNRSERNRSERAPDQPQDPGVDRDVLRLPSAGWRTAPDHGRSEPRPCPHAGEPARAPLRITGCEECQAAGRGDWVHLRVCLACGHNGCCDSSPGAHAWKHAQDTCHAVAAAVESPWAWCYVDDVFLVPVESEPGSQPPTPPL
ncbi:UBP-type zinc finger domain-containing protein [Streptomyces roseus]|uniref:UBP-type zinc finger domain-containing protein n=1 Tax=Streptomyces roseus TaxID=66430 RepID=UPI00099D864B